MNKFLTAYKLQSGRISSQIPRRLAAPTLRKEVHNMLRDVAFVLAQTRRVRDEMLQEQHTCGTPGST